MDHSPALYAIYGKKHVFMQSFKFDERRWQRTSTARYQIDITVVLRPFSVRGNASPLLFALECVLRRCLPAHFDDDDWRCFFPSSKWRFISGSPSPSLSPPPRRSTSSFAICQKGRTSDRSQAVLFTPPSLRGQGSDQAAPAANLDCISDGHCASVFFHVK